MARKLMSTDDFKNEIYSLVGDEYEVLSKYRGRNKYIKMRHNTCGHEYEVRPSRFIDGRRCPDCYAYKAKTNEEFNKEVSELSLGRIIHMGNYKNATTVTIFKNIDNDKIFEMTPNRFLTSGYKQILALSDGSKNISNSVHIVTDRNGIYKEIINSGKKKVYKHNKCNIEILFKETPNNDTRCPVCFDKRVITMITNLLEKNYISVSKQVRISDIKVPVQMLLDDYNIIIEYRGLLRHYNYYDHMITDYHKIQKESDKEKVELSRHSEFNILFIDYWDAHRIPEIMKSLVNFIKTKKHITINNFNTWRRSLKLKSLSKYKKEFQKK